MPFSVGRNENKTNGRCGRPTHDRSRASRGDKEDGSWFSILVLLADVLVKAEKGRENEAAEGANPFVLFNHRIGSDMFLRYSPSIAPQRLQWREPIS
jgi:hypothetical protein